MFFGKSEADKIVFRITEDNCDRIGLGVINKVNPRNRINGPESFPFLSICLVMHGRGSYENHTTGQRHELSPGMFFLRLPGNEHTIRINLEEHWLEYFLNLGNFAWPYFKHYFSLAENTPVGKFVPDEEWRRRFRSLLDRAPQIPLDRLAEMFQELFSLASECVRNLHGQGREHTMVHEGCIYLSSDFSRPYDIRRFCREKGWGYDNFRKIFTQQTGIPPNHYRLCRRMDAARALLIQKELSVAVIAQMLGYCSPGEFSAKFKKFFGIPPLEFRRTLPPESFTGLGSISGSNMRSNPEAGLGRRYVAAGEQQYPEKSVG